MHIVCVVTGICISKLMHEPKYIVYIHAYLTIIDITKCRNASDTEKV